MLLGNGVLRCVLACLCALGHVPHCAIHSVLALACVQLMIARHGLPRGRQLAGWMRHAGFDCVSVFK